jgi:orotidine-5'-phosphate decarboxylase
MSEQPERPAQPGVGTTVPKDAVASVQAALDATFNDHARSSAQVVEDDLRAQLKGNGVDASVTDAWIVQAAREIAEGNPVVATPGDA